MKNKFLVIGGIAATTLLASGWALAQSPGRGPGEMMGMGSGMHGGMGSGMHGQMGSGMQGQMGSGMHGQMGPGMQGQMGSGMHGQMGPGMRGHMGSGMMHGGMGMTQFDPARIDTLKTELGITAAQEPTWTKYVKAIQDSATTMQTAHEGMDPNAAGKMGSQDHFTFMTKMREQRQQQFEAVQTAAKELLAGLDDAQKAKARDILPGLASGRGMRGAMAEPQHGH